jgi:hypothetical protein
MEAEAEEKLGKTGNGEEKEREESRTEFRKES